MAAIKMSTDLEGAEVPKDELMKLIDAEVDRFSNYMATLADPMARGPLNRPERALVKTYIVQKLRGALDG
jgi:hypothetical protein